MKNDEVVSNGSQSSVFALMVSIIDRPKSTFEEVLPRRDVWVWLLPLLLVVVCLAIMVAVQAPHSMELGLQQMEQRLSSMPADQAEQAREQAGKFTSLPFVLGSSLIVGIVMFLGSLVIQSAVLYFATLVAGGEVNFGSMFRLSVWSRLPYAISYLVMSGFMLVTNQMIMYPGLSSLVATGNFMEDRSDPLVALLGAIDPFWLWHLWLVVVGLAVAAHFSRRKSLVIAIIYAALMLGLTVVPSLLFSGAGA